jgi:hypothetical protein
MKDPRRLESRGLALTPPTGWSAHLGMRDASTGEESHPVLHAATFPLPARRGDYGSSATSRMGGDDVFVALLEFSMAARATALFAAQGLPRPVPDDYTPHQLQRTVPGQAGYQRFFTWNGRPFCLYVVLGSHAGRARLAPKVHQLLDGLTAERPLFDLYAGGTT